MSKLYQSPHLIKNTNYVGSYVDVTSCPQNSKQVFAFIGRSNVGKSTLINALCNHKGLAKTSVTPGKTKTINYFEINKEFYFVDLPGYGFAKVSKNQRNNWAETLFQYFKNLSSLKQVLVLIDVSIPPQQMDIDFLNDLGKRQVPFVIVFTKSDKNIQKIVQQHIHTFEEKLQESWELMPRYFLTSAKKLSGVNNILNFIIQENVMTTKV